MHLITQRDIIRQIASKWSAQYAPFQDYSPRWRREGEIKLGVFMELTELDKETATKEDVDKIIGNESWTRIKCDQCKKEVTAVLQVGEPLSYESATANLCQKCVEQVSAISWENVKVVAPPPAGASAETGVKP